MSEKGDNSKPVEGATAVADPNEPEYVEGEAKSSDKVEWPQGILRLPVQNWITAEDLGFSERNKLSIVRDAKKGNAKAIGLLNKVCNVLLELMARDTEERHVVNDRGQPLFFDEDGRKTTEYRSETKKDLDGRPLRYRPVIEVRSKHGVRAGRETGTGPGGKWNRPGEWKLRVQEHFHELFPKLVYREHAPAFPAGKFGKVQGVVEYAKQKHAEGMDPETGMERQQTLKWLNEFLKDPTCKWDGEK